MRKYPRVSLLALAALAAFALSGCFAATPVEPPAPTASATPVFASEKEALAAATEAYAAYLAVSDQVGNDGGSGVDRLATFLSVQYFDEQERSYLALQSEGLRTSGRTTFEPPILQSVERIDRVAVISLYVCVDVTNVRIIDQAGADVTSAERPNRYPLVVELEATKADELRMTSSSPWTGESFCLIER